MSKRHTLGEAAGYSFTHQAAASFGNGSAKALEVHVEVTEADGVRGHFRVMNRGEMVLVTNRLQDAVNAYNELP